MDVQGFLQFYGGFSDATKRTYRNSLIMLGRYISGDEPTEDEVKAFLRQFKRGTTLQKHKAAIHRYFRYKKRPWDLDPKEFISAEKRLPRYLARDQVNHLIDCAGDEHEKMFVQTMFITGIRIAELMSLTRKSVEPDGIRIIGKGDKERVVPILNKTFRQELAEYAAKHTGKLFPETYYNYWLMLRKLCLKAGVPMVSPHTLRHSAAVDLINRGLPLGGVQRLLGHTQEATTLIYARLTETDLRREMERLEEKSG